MRFLNKQKNRAFMARFFFLLLYYFKKGVTEYLGSLIDMTNFN